MEENKIIKIFMPIVKTIGLDGEEKNTAVLSDDSLDLDKESMHKNLIKYWAENKSLPALIDHKNSMDAYHADWENIRYIENGENAALMADPVTIPTERGKELAIQLKYLRNIGVSITALPEAHEFIEKEINGVKKKVKVYTKAKLLEASFIPIQSNEHARAMRIAKSFNIHTPNQKGEELDESQVISKPASVERCVEALMNNPKFKPRGGKTKEESAWAVCQAAQKKGFSTVRDFIDASEENMDYFKKYLIGEEEMQIEELKKELDALKKEMEEMKPKPAEEPEKEKPEAPEEEAESKALKEELATLKKQIVEMKSKPIKKEAIEEDPEEDVEKGWNLNDAIRKGYGVKKK